MYSIKLYPPNYILSSNVNPGSNNLSIFPSCICPAIKSLTHRCKYPSFIRRIFWNLDHLNQAKSALKTRVPREILKWGVCVCVWREGGGGGRGGHNNEEGFMSMVGLKWWLFLVLCKSVWDMKIGQTFRTSFRLFLPELAWKRLAELYLNWHPNFERMSSLASKRFHNFTETNSFKLLLIDLTEELKYYILTYEDKFKS